MEKRTIVALALLAAAGGAVVWAKSRPDKYAAKSLPPGTAPAGAPAAVKPEDVDRLEIREAGKPALVLRRTAAGAGPGAEGWMLVEPVADRADPRAVEAALKTLGEMQWKEIVARTPESHEKLAVREADAVRVVAKKGDQVLVDLWIGKTGKVRLAGQDEVWTVQKLNRLAFTKELKLWRFREVFRFDKSEVDRLEVSVAGAPKVVVKRVPPPTPPAGAADAGVPAAPAAPDTWELVEGGAAVGGELDATVAVGVMNGLTRLDMADFADGVTAEAAGLVPPRAVVAAVLTGGARKAIEIGKVDGELAYARVEGEPRIFKLRASTADTLARPPLQWRDKTLAKIEGKDVVKLELEKAGEKLTFTRDPAIADAATAWKAVPPEAVPELDPARVQGVAAGFANLRAGAIASVGANDPAAGFARPTGRVKVYTAAGLALDLTVGALVDHQYHVKVAGRPEVFLVPEATAMRWLKTAAELKKSPPPPPGRDPHQH